MYAHQALEFLLSTVEFVVVYPALLRFYLQLFRAPARNPLSAFIISLTDFAIRPLRRFIPPMQGLDLASLFWAWISECLVLLMFLGVMGANLFGGPGTLPAIAFLAIVKLFKFSIYLLIFATLAQALLSWTTAYHPLMAVLEALCVPFLRPLRRVVPTLGNVDLSPLVLLVLCQLLLIVPIQALESAAIRLIPFGH